MSELDLRDNPWRGGYPHDPTILYNDLFFLATTFGASKNTSTFRKTKGDAENSSSLFSIFRNFEYSEASKRILAVAVICRNELKITEYKKSDFKNVGEIKKGRTKKQDLDLLTACHKIIHARDINFDLTIAKDIRSGYLKPVIYLYGSEKNQGVTTEWKATLRIFDFIEEVFKVL